MKILHWMDYARGETNIVFYSDILSDRREIHNLFSRESITIKRGMEIPEDFIMRYCGHIREFLSAFTETMDAESVKTNNEIRNEGLLKATQYHLEDMRTLVFKVAP